MHAPARLCYESPFNKILMPQREPPRESRKRAGRESGEARRGSRDRKSGTVTVSLRIPVPMLKEIDEAVQVRPYKMPRHLWLLEAIHEKLTRLRQTDSK